MGGSTILYFLQLTTYPLLSSFPPFPSLDLKFEDIDESLWKSGMAINHGFDAKGQNVVILNIAMHRKDSKKAPMLRKWIAFSYEMHVSSGYRKGAGIGVWLGLH